MKLISRALWSIALLLGAVTSTFGSAAAQAVDEDTLRAAFVVNFLRYTEWPVQSIGPDEPLVVLVVGADRSSALVRKMAAVAGERSGRPIEVRHLRLPGSHERAQTLLKRRMDNVHAVFVAAPEPEAARTVIELAHGRPVLTIGVGEEFVRAGGMLALIRDGSHVAFASNTRAILSSPVSVSSKVLKISRPLPQELLGPDGAQRHRGELQIAQHSVPSSRRISRRPSAPAPAPAPAARGC